MSFATTDERVLFHIAKSSFLSIWSFSNLYRDQGDANRGGDGKELCDFAAIFGRDVLLFSDKRVVYREDIDESIAWQRWHKTAVVSSVRQLKGAERWMVNYPDRIFTDKKCNHLLEIPFPSNPIFHKVVVTHGLEETLKTKYRESSFSYTTTSGVSYVINQTEYIHGEVVHIFTGDTLMFLMNQVDTTQDFVGYLKERENVFKNGSGLFVSKESDLVHMYYKAEQERDKETQLQALSQRIYPICTYSSGINGLLQDPFYKNKKDEDQLSYFWDMLIEHISGHIVRGTAEGSNVSELRDSEVLLRRLAEQNRFGRRRLANAFWQKWIAVAPGMRGNRIISERESNVLYVFMFIPEESFENNEHYRDFRRKLLAECVTIFGMEQQTFSEVVGIAAKTRETENNEVSQTVLSQLLLSGVDFTWFDNTEWKEEDIWATEQSREELVKNGFLSHSDERTESHLRSHEFE